MSQDTFIVFRGTDGRYGIEDSFGALVYEPDFETVDQAQAIASAHNNGAETYEDACVMVRSRNEAGQ